MPGNGVKCWCLWFVFYVTLFYQTPHQAHFRSSWKCMLCTFTQTSTNNLRNMILSIYDNEKTSSVNIHQKTICCSFYMWISKSNDIKPEFKVKALFWRSNGIYIYAEGTPKEYHRRLGIQNRRKLENETWRTILPNTVSKSIRSILEQCANRIK